MDHATEVLRTAPSPKIPISDLARQSCVCCGNTDLSVSRYPAFISRFFAGLILAHCGQCGLSWIPIPDLDLDAYYTKHYAKEFRKDRLFEGKFYSKANPVWDMEVHPVRDRARVQARELEPFKPFGRLLDIGCGEGFLLHAVEAREKYALELDENVQDILTGEIGAELVTDLSRPDFYDAIVASHVVEHFTYENIREKFREIASSLKSGGVFLCEVPDGADQIEKFSRGERPPTQRLEPHTLFFSSYAICRLMVDEGFSILRTKVCNWTAANVERAEIERIVDGETRDGGRFIIIARKV